MPLTRSRDNLANLDESSNASFLVEAGTSDTVQRSRSQGRIKQRPVDRASISNNESSNTQIRQIVSELLVSFQQEMMSVMSNEISNMFRNLQLPATTNNQNNNTNIVPNNNSDGIQNSPSNSDFRSNQDPFYAEKVLNIIRNWRLKFTGHNNEMNVDEFIYRINILTTNNLGGDFELLCKHAHTIFDGKALEWYWRFHRQNNDIEWSSLTSALRVQYKSDYNDYDILDDIRRRKQKPSETFDDYFDIISSMTDRLRTPLSELDFCKTFIRNLKPEIKLELLHLDISNVSQLRKEARKHEKFVKEYQALEYRKFPKGRLAELAAEFIGPKDSNVDNKTEICAIQQILICWNCEKPGHTYMDCMETRRIFCYGCGAKDMYKPNCTKCKNKIQGNAQKDVRRF